jgi:hypothetical protein
MKKYLCGWNGILFKSVEVYALDLMNAWVCDACDGL